MKKSAKTLAAIAAVLLLTLALTACAALDMVGKDSVRAFGDLLEALPAQGSEQDGWSIEAPDGLASFTFDSQSVGMVVSAQPFVDAGLDLSKLDNATGSDIVFLSPGFNMLNVNVQSTPLDQFRVNVRPLRRYLGYHTQMDHYQIDMGEGNMFEWAKDMQTNGYNDENQDKDIVFVLNPEPLIEAGVQPDQVEGWIYAQVPIEKNGKTTDVWKFLKPYDLK